MLGQLIQGIGGKAYTGAARYVVQNDRQIAAVCDCGVVCDQTALRSLVIVRRNRQTGICAAFSCKLGQLNGVCGVVGTRAGNDRNTVVDILTAPGNGFAMLLIVQGRCLAGGAADNDGIRAVCDLVVDDLAEFFVIDLTGGLERRDNSNRSTGKNRLLHSKNAPP